MQYIDLVRNRRGHRSIRDFTGAGLLAAVGLGLLSLFGSTLLAKSPAAATISKIKVEVRSTHDDKDREIAFEFIVQDKRVDAGKVAGTSGKVGGGEIWDESLNAVEFAVTPFPYSERLNYKINHKYHNLKNGNQGWEGKITVYGQIARWDLDQNP